MRALFFTFITLFFVCVQGLSCAEVLSVNHKGYFTHKVQRGQSLSLISKLYFGDFSRVNNLKSINHLKGDVIYVDQVLKIPQFEVVLNVVRGDTLSKLSQEYFCGLSNYKKLASMNGISNPYQIEVGQKLKIPLCKSFFQNKDKKKIKRKHQRKLSVNESGSKRFSSQKSPRKHTRTKINDIVGVETVSEDRLESSRLVRKPFVYELDELRYVPKLEDNKVSGFSGSLSSFAKSKSYEATYMDEISKPILPKRDIKRNRVDFIPQSFQAASLSQPKLVKRKVRRKDRFKSLDNLLLDPDIVDQSVQLIRSSKKEKKRPSVIFGRTNTAKKIRKAQRRRSKSTKKTSNSQSFNPTIKKQTLDKQLDSVEEKMNLFGLSSAQNASTELFSNKNQSVENSPIVSNTTQQKRSRSHGIRGLFSGIGKLQGSSDNWDRRDLYSEALRSTVSIGLESFSITPKQSDFGVGKVNSASMPVFKASKPVGRGGDVSFLAGAWSSKNTDNQIKTTLESKYDFLGFSMSTTELLAKNIGLRLELGLIQASNEVLYSDSFGFSFSSKDKGLFAFASSSLRYRLTRDLEFSLSLAYFGGKFNHSSLVSTQTHAPLDLSDTALGFGLHYRF